jgi:hypothetical protein
MIVFSLRFTTSEGLKSGVRNNVDDTARVLVKPIERTIGQEAILDELGFVRCRLLVDLTPQTQASEQVGQAQSPDWHSWQLCHSACNICAPIDSALLTDR